jgi:hypothetical protein
MPVTSAGAAHMISRRQLLTSTGSGIALATTGLPVISACAAAPVVATSVVAGATGAWLSEFANSIAGALAAKVADGAEWLFEEAWKAWQKPTNELGASQTSQGFGYMSNYVYGHMIPGTTLVGISRGSHLDPMPFR